MYGSSDSIGRDKPTQNIEDFLFATKQGLREYTREVLGEQQYEANRPI
jgi:hypothetical protein